MNMKGNQQVNVNESKMNLLNIGKTRRKKKEETCSSFQSDPKTQALTEANYGLFPSQARK